MAHLQQAGQRIELPEVPEAGEHILSWFWELNAGRGSSGFGPNSLSYTEIEAWVRLSGEQVNPLEIQIIKAMDVTYLSGWSDEH